MYNHLSFTQQSHTTNLLLRIISVTNARCQSHDKCVNRCAIFGPTRFNYLTTCCQDTFKHCPLAAAPSVSLAIIHSINCEIAKLLTTSSAFRTKNNLYRNLVTLSLHLEKIKPIKSTYLCTHRQNQRFKTDEQHA